jgi:hypothetical protein
VFFTYSLACFVSFDKTGAYANFSYFNFFPLFLKKTFIFLTEKYFLVLFRSEGKFATQKKKEINFFLSHYSESERGNY